MSIVTNIEAWGNDHRPVWLDFLRIALGLYLTYKGIIFMIDFPNLELITEGMDMFFAGSTIAHYVMFAHTIGGALIVFGLFTRVASALQVPILIGAVFLVNYPKGFLSIGNHMELEISIAVFVLLLVMLIFGAGKLSIDSMRRKESQIN